MARFNRGIKNNASIEIPCTWIWSLGWTWQKTVEFPFLEDGLATHLFLAYVRSPCSAQWYLNHCLNVLLCSKCLFWCVECLWPDRVVPHTDKLDCISYIRSSPGPFPGIHPSLSQSGCFYPPSPVYYTHSCIHHKAWHTDPTHILTTVHNIWNKVGWKREAGHIQN